MSDTPRNDACKWTPITDLASLSRQLERELAEALRESEDRNQKWADKSIYASQLEQTIANINSQLTAHKDALEKCEKACTPLVKNNGGPICAEDTVDGQEYVMVKLQDFDGVVKALSEIAKLKPFDSVNSTQSSQ